MVVLSLGVVLVIQSVTRNFNDKLVSIPFMFSVWLAGCPTGCLDGSPDAHGGQESLVGRVNGKVLEELKH